MTYKAFNGMEFETDEMVDLIESELQYMKKVYRQEWLEEYPKIKIKDGFYSAEDMTEKEITEMFDLMVNSDTIDLMELGYTDESTSIYGGW